MATTASPTDSLDLILRFSTAHPDLLLPVSHSNATTGLDLKQHIRRHLPSPYADARLRLICAGKIVPDDKALGKSLIVAVPPRARADDEKGKGNGKLPVRDAAARVYIHVSVGDSLAPSELAAEKQQAVDAAAALQEDASIRVTPTSQYNATAHAYTTPAPQGFDRLASAGFTAAEVTALRTQFLAIQSHTHTPDTMPQGAALLALEEAWLNSTSTNTASDSPEAGGFGSEDAGGLEDMLYGNLIGFFWPVGAMGWVMREEGVWTRRRQIAVLGGFLVNLTFGFLRYQQPPCRSCQSCADCWLVRFMN